MAVTTSLSGGVLTISGDNTSDDIAIVGTATAGTIQVIGRNGTFVDGTPNGLAVISGVTSDLTVSLGDGDNAVIVDNVYLAGDLRLNTGAGDDQIILGATGVASTTGDCIVSTGTGDDVVRVEDYKVFIGQRMQVLLDGGDRSFVSLVGASARTSIEVFNSGVSGANEVFLQGVTSGGVLTLTSDTRVNSIAVLTSAASGQLNVWTESGHNSIYVDTCYSAEAIFVDSVSRHATSNPPAAVSPSFNIDATITIARCLARNVLVFTTSDEPLVYLGGNDTVTLYGNYLVGPVSSHTVRVDTGDGNDRVEAFYNVALGNLFASLADGDDTLTLIGNSISGFASADGGSGTNRLSMSDNSFEGLAAIRFS